MKRTRVETTVLSCLSAAWCGLSLIAFGAFLTVSTGTTLYNTLIERGVNAAEHAGKICSIGFFGSFTVFVSGLAFGRFLLRALPPQSTNRARRIPLRGLGVIAVCLAFFGLFYVAVIGYFVLAVSTPAQSNLPDLDVMTNLTSLGVTVLFAPFWASGAIGPLVLRYRHRRAFLNGPFVLFLRRFSTFADRAVIAMVLRQAASGVPVVFLTPTFSRSRDWDPFVVGFAGLKLIHPWMSVPIVLHAVDDDWQRAADELIRRARTILLDTSETSSALRIEIEMIEMARRWPDTVVLRQVSLNIDASMDLLGRHRGAHVIDYAKSWVWALPRMVIGLIIVQLAVLPVEVLLYPVISRFPSPVSFFLILAVAAAYYSVCVRPTINREARRALRTVLRAGT